MKSIYTFLRLQLQYDKKMFYIILNDKGFRAYAGVTGVIYKCWVWKCDWN